MYFYGVHLQIGACTQGAGCRIAAATFSTALEEPVPVASVEAVRQLRWPWLGLPRQKHRRRFLRPQSQRALLGFRYHLRGIPEPRIRGIPEPMVCRIVLGPLKYRSLVSRAVCMHAVGKMITPSIESEKMISTNWGSPILGDLLIAL